MNIRKFEAGSFEEALQRVKSELGPDALVLSSERKRRGWFQSPVVEITAAFEQPSEKEWDDSALEKIFPHRRSRAPTEVDPEREGDKEDSPVATARMAGMAIARGPSEVEESFLGVGLQEETARELARQIVFDFSKKDRSNAAFLEKVKVKLLARSMKTLTADIFQTRRTWAAVGSPGSGKTTLLVKLALSLQAKGHLVCFGSHDRRKIVGCHEMAAYARLIGAPFNRGIGGERKNNQLMLFDTPSVGTEGSGLFKEVEKSSRDASTLIVLDASQRLSELLRTVDRFSRLAPVALAFTRLDLVSQAGVVYDTLKHTKLPLLGFSVSDSFSRAFRFFESAALARYLLQKPCEKDRQLEIIETTAFQSREPAV